MIEYFGTQWQKMLSEPLFLAAIIVGFLAVIENMFLYVSNKRERILTMKLISDLLWGINYLLLGKFTGTALNAIAAVRECIFAQRGKHKWADSRLWVALFVALVLISPALEWISAGGFVIAPLFAAAGSVIIVIALFQKNTLVIKILTLAGLLLWLVYALLSDNIPGIIAQIISIGSCIIGLIRERHTKEP